METLLPQTFLSFLSTILQAEISTDQQKSKIFYKTSKEIIQSFETEITVDKEQEPFITLDSLCSLLERNCGYQQSESHHTLCEEEKKVLSKYFRFHDFYTCTKQQFLKKLKPINNKLIVGLETQSRSTEQLIRNIVVSILKGYEKIRLIRAQCGSEYEKIVAYFKTNLESDFLSKQSLKQFMYEANIYGRINYNYLKEYIFGQNQQTIHWSQLFKRQIYVPDQIKELSEQNIVSEQQLQLNVEKSSSVLKQEEQQNKGIFIQSISQIIATSEPVSVKQLFPCQSDYSKVLSQISHIESLLNRTKEKYQKNRQELHNQTQSIRNSQLKRSEMNRQLMSKNKTNYQQLKIKDESVKNTPVNKLDYESQAEKPAFQTQKPLLLPRDSKLKNKQYGLMQESSVRPFVSRQAMKKQIQETLKQKSVHANSQASQKRQVGKIKRRSVSKDIQKAKNQLCRNQIVSSSTQKREYSQYEAVLKEIKKQQNVYRKLVQDRQRHVYQKQIKQRAVLELERGSYKKHNLALHLQPSGQHKTSYLQNKKYSEGQISNFVKTIEPNTLQRSRVSSKKREEIVQKATSEARLRIQEIQNRALSRLSKLDVSGKQNQAKINKNYLNIDKTDKQEIPRYKNRLKTENCKIKNNLSGVRTRFLMSQLLNERPNLKLSQ